MNVSVEKRKAAGGSCALKVTEERNRSTKIDGRVHVVVADDNDSVRSLIVKLLESEGYLVSSAAGGKEALETIANGGVDVALADVRMPDMSGLEVLRRGKEIDPQLEVILITGLADTETATEAVRCGAYGFIKKPFEDIRQIPGLVHGAAEERVRKREVDEGGFRGRIASSGKSFRR